MHAVVFFQINTLISWRTFGNANVIVTTVNFLFYFKGNCCPFLYRYFSAHTMLIQLPSRWQKSSQNFATNKNFMPLDLLLVQLGCGFKLLCMYGWYAFIMSLPLNANLSWTNQTPPLNLWWKAEIKSTIPTQNRLFKRRN